MGLYHGRRWSFLPHERMLQARLARGCTISRFGVGRHAPGEARRGGATALARESAHGVVDLPADLSLVSGHAFCGVSFRPHRGQGGCAACGGPGLLCVNGAVPASSLSDVISLARAKPGRPTYGNPGNFTAGHLAMEMLKAQSRVDIIPVPYRGGAPALKDLVAGQIQMSISGPSNFLQYIKNGQLRAVASTSLKRSTALPDVPTFSESGMAGF